jgi:Tfp pilus assembly protein FimT
MKRQYGYTLPEILITIGIFFTLIGLVTVDLIKTQRHASISATVDSIVSDMRSQQTKAMTGTNDGTGNGNSYGIYFQADRYILFRGTSYVANDATNFTVTIDKGSTLSTISFPSSTLVFTQQSGEISGFVSGQNTLTVKSANGTEQKVITINRYGTVSQEQ